MQETAVSRLIISAGTRVSCFLCAKYTKTERMKGEKAVSLEQIDEKLKEDEKTP